MKARALIIAASCLLAGLAAQTLVAWTLFIHSDYTGGTGILRDPPLAPGHRTDTGFVIPADWTSRTLVQWWGTGKSRETFSECEWTGSTLGQMNGMGRQATYQGFSAGWPLRSFGGTDYITPGLEAAAPVALRDVPNWIKAGGHKVPVSPLWIGLAVNTVLFSLPAFAAAWVWGWASRCRRRRLGLCLGCGYLVKGLKRCPECGVDGAEA
jgi:hypothetical protein